MAFVKMLLKRVLLLLVLYQLCRLLFLAFNHTYFHSLTLKVYLLISYGGFRFDLSTIMYLNALYILLFIIPFPVRYNVHYRLLGKIIFILTNTVGIAANLIDCAYYPFTLQRTNAAFFHEFSNDIHLLKNTGAFIYSYWYIALLIILFIGFLILSYNRIAMPKKEKFNWLNFSFQTALLPFMAILWLGFARGSFIPNMRPINISKAGDYIHSPAEVNIVINTPFSILTTWQSYQVPPVDYFPSDNAAAIYYSPVQSYSTTGSVKKKNVVIIIVESLSKEFIGSLNRDKKDYHSYTPFIDSLIYHSLTFGYAFANGRTSIDALPSVTSGIPSLVQPYILTPYIGNNITSIAALLKKHNYQTSFYHGGHEGTMDFNGFAKIAGFTTTHSKDDYNNDKDYDGTWGIYDEEYLQYWAQQLNVIHQPFCSTLFTVTSHHPFTIPERYNAKFAGGELPIDRTIQYTDYSLQKFFETASKMPWYQNTLFVITADHAAPYSWYQQYQNPAGAFAIPIIFFTPDSSLTGFRNELAQQTDIFPTIMDYLGLKDTIIAFGKSLLSNTNDHFVVNYYSGLYQIFKGDLVMQFDGKHATALYLFKDDPTLQNNLLGKYPEKEKLMTFELKAYLQQYSYRIRENKLTP